MSISGTPRWLLAASSDTNTSRFTPACWQALNRFCLPVQSIS